MGFYKNLICLGMFGFLTACGGSGGGGSAPASSAASSGTLASSTVVVSSSTATSTSLPSSSSLLSSSSSSVGLPANRNLTHARWSFDTKAKVRSTAVISSDAVIFGTDSGTLYALNRDNGSEQWRVDTGGAISSHLLLIDGKVIFLNYSGKIMALDARSGTQVWSKTVGSEYLRPWGHHLASAIAVDDRIYIGTSSGKVYGLAHASGAEVWSIDIKSAVHTRPALVNGTLFVSSDSAVHALDIAAGKQLWSRQFNNPTSPAVADNTLVVGSRDARVFGLDASTGADRWNIAHGPDWVTGDPVILDGIAYIGSSDDKKYQAINLVSGALAWEIGTGGNVFAKPVFHGDVSYISAGDSYATPGSGRVSAVTKAGKVLWTLSGKNFFASPVVDGESVYIGSDDGYFYAFPAL